MLKHMQSILCKILLLSVILCAARPALAAGTVSIVQAGGSTFNLVAQGLNGPAGYDIVLSYDATKLSTNPSVVLGPAATGALLSVNTQIPGSIHFGVLKDPPMNGTGVVVKITFDLKADSPGPITIVQATVIDRGGNRLNPTFVSWAPPAPVVSSDSGDSGGLGAGSGSGQTQTQTQTTTSTGGSGGTYVGGTLTMPTDDAGAKDRKEAQGQAAAGQPQPGQQEARETTAPAASAETAVNPDVQAAGKKTPGYTPRQVQSVLEKFRLFTGEKTPNALAALFDPEQGAPFVQKPPVCLADGTATVQVVVSKVFTEKAPSFTFSHAGYVSITQTGDGEWQVEVKPDKGAVRASVTMLVDGVQQDIPLTVAPAADVDLDKSGGVTEADFQLFLKNRGTESAPKHDLNRDGKRDYQDDYIFTANYLLKKGVKPGKETPPPAQKKQP